MAWVDPGQRLDADAC